MKKHIPNILSVIRLLMIPVFVYVYFAESSTWSLCVYTAAWVTDVADGYLARRNGWVTNVGKILDPLADKLMQVTALMCLFIDGRIYVFAVVLLVVKEMLMMFGAIFIFRSKRVVVASDWYGKFGTVVLFAGVIVLLLVEDPAPWLELLISMAIVAVSVFSLTMYAVKAFSKEDTSSEGKEETVK